MKTDYEKETAEMAEKMARISAQEIMRRIIINIPCDLSCKEQDRFIYGMTNEIKRNVIPELAKLLRDEASCVWKYNDSTGSYDTQCGEKFQFTFDGVNQNGFKFCPYCGDSISEVAIAKSDNEQPGRA